MILNISELEDQYPLAWKDICNQIALMKRTGCDAEVLPFRAEIRGRKLIVAAQTDLVMEGFTDCMVVEFHTRLPANLSVVN